MGIDLSSGLWYCHRCGNGGKLTAAQFIEYTSGIDIAMPENLLDLSEYDNLPYRKDTRFTMLPSKYNFDENYRQWAMRKPNGDIVGYHHRFDGGKQSENIGHRGLGYIGKELTTTDIIRVVEGVYDVVLPNDVCLFGKITTSSLKMLKHYPLCLCPDSDILYVKSNLVHFAKTVRQNTNVEYVELLPTQYNDPGDMYAYDQQARGKIVTRSTFLHRVNSVLDNHSEL
jgi:hypothetical protein